MVEAAGTFMSLLQNYNATVTFARETRDGEDDGTPIYTRADVVVRGFFDELETRTIEEPFRKDSIPFADRRALFMTATLADIQQDDKGTVVMDMPDGSTFPRGVWMVSVIRTAPKPRGPGHLEVQFQGTQESR